MFNVFLFEKESNLERILTSQADEIGELHTFHDKASALRSIHEYPHLWIIDSSFSDADGDLILQQIKEQTTYIPTIYICAHDVDFERINTLDLEYDDFLITPFSPQELVIRTKRLLKRSYPTTNQYYQPIALHPYILHEGKREALLGTDRIKLTSKEFDLLLYLAKYRGKAISREQIISQIWGNDHVGSDRLVDDLVRRLRNKMQEISIETLYGYGYRMNL